MAVAQFLIKKFHVDIYYEYYKNLESLITISAKMRNCYRKRDTA